MQLLKIINVKEEIDKESMFTNSYSKRINLYTVKKKKSARNVSLITVFLSYDNIKLTSGIHCQNMCELTQIQKRGCVSPMIVSAVTLGENQD